MKKWLASTAAIVALIVLPIDTGSAYPGSGHGGGGGHSGGGGNHSSGGNGNHSSGGSGNHSGNGNNSSGNGNNSSGNGNNSSGNGSRHSSNSNGHPNSNNHTNSSSHTNSSNSSSHNHTNNSNGHNNNNNNNGHYHYTHQHGHAWDSKEWNHAWYRHWYHDHFIFWNGGWIWWDPDRSQYVPYVEGQYIPEDYYVQGDEPPAGGGAILVVNPTDTQSTINYAINDNDYQIAPGSQQELSADQQWVISFDRGENDGNAEYTLSPGIYTFGPSDHGWELYHTSDSVEN